MTLAELQEYLKGFASSGLTAAQLTSMAQVAAEAGYKGVWSAYPWTIRRGTTNLATVANQAFTNLPADFESAIKPRSTGSGTRYLIDIMDEPDFDASYPDPSVMTGRPSVCKIVWESPATKYRAVWYPLPNAVYSFPFAYHRAADMANLPNLPGWMLKAIVTASVVLMQPTTEKQLNATAVAKQALSDAIDADRIITRPGEVFGDDPGWDEFHWTGAFSDDYMKI